MSNSKENKITEWYLNKLDKDKYLKEKSKVEKLFDELVTHPLIREVSRDHFRNEQYRNAVLDALIRLEEMIKEKAKFPKDNKGKELSGCPLIFKVFDFHKPILNWCSGDRQIEKDELSGYCYIMAGTFLGIRDPKAHAIFKSRPMRALQLLILATLLAEIVDASKYVEQSE